MPDRLPLAGGSPVSVRPPGFSCRTASLALGVWLAVGIPIPASAQPTGEHTPSACERMPSLADVLERVKASPRMQAALSDTEAQRELTRQAGARPNPELLLELEDFTGSGSYADFGQSQTTLSFTQRIELGGVRDRRVDAAAREGDAVAARGVAGGVRAEATAKQQYVELLASTEGLAAANDGERLARTFLADTERRGASAAASEADVARARVSLATAELAIAEQKRNVAIAAERLVASWGGTAAESSCFAESSVRHPAALPPVPARRAVLAAAALSPAVRVAEAEVETMRAEAELARASAAPGLEVGAGLRHLAPDDVSAVAQLRVEVPIFDRNTGAIAAAERKLTAAQSRALAVRREAEARIERLRETLDAAAARERRIAATMIPSAEAAASSLSRAWQSGAASTFEMLEARRAVLDLRRQRIDAASEYYRTLATLEAVTGTVTPTLDARAARTED